MFWSKEMELTMLGLQGAGKTTLVNVIAVSLGAPVPSRPLPSPPRVAAPLARPASQLQPSSCTARSTQRGGCGGGGRGGCKNWGCDDQVGEFTEDTIPTVGFNMRKVNKGNVTIKFWDLGGQPRFRGMWERYCRGVSAIV